MRRYARLENCPAVAKLSRLLNKIKYAVIRAARLAFPVRLSRLRVDEPSPSLRCINFDDESF